MRTKEQYKSWFLPVLQRDAAYSDFINALAGEVVQLQKYNMGSYNAVGFNGVEEDVDVLDGDAWFVVSAFNPATAQYTTASTGFTFGSDYLQFAQTSGTRYAVYNYAFVLGREYTVRFTLYNISLTGSLELSLGIGDTSQHTIVIDISMDDPTEVEVTLTAEDYWMGFAVFAGTDNGSFRIKDLQVTGVEASEDDDVRTSVLKRLLNVDNAGEFVLDAYQRSFAFPDVEGLPPEIVRQFIKDYPTFVSYKGSRLASIMFFYFLGYSAEFVELYARKGDYNADFYSYTQQQDKDDLVSDTTGTVYAEVAETRSATRNILLKSGHQVIPGDRITYGDNNSPYVATREFTKNLVTGIDGNVITVESAVTVYADDMLDIERVYPYGVNPDPTNLFKTSHLDVFFSKKFTAGIDIDFIKLERYFEFYLPINVVIRFFGFSSEVDDEEFTIEEAYFRFKTVNAEDIEISETPTFPVDAFTYVVVNTEPFTHLDINGTEVDGYSYAIAGYSGTEPIYTIIE